MNNPLLQEFKNEFGIPPFDLIKEEHYIPAFDKAIAEHAKEIELIISCLLYTSPSPRDLSTSRMPSSA